MGRKKSRTSRTRRQAGTLKPTERVVPRHEQQWAVIGNTVLDIEAAFQILRGSQRRTARIDVAAWARLYGMDGNPDSPITVGPLFDPDHARTADLRRPLILITITTSGGYDVELIADGAHRLHRALLEGRDSLPAHILTAAETQAITLSRPDRKDPAPGGTPRFGGGVNL